MGRVQIVPLGFEVLPFTVQPVMVPMLYSCLLPWDCCAVMLVSVSAAVVSRKKSCTALR